VEKIKASFALMKPFMRIEHLSKSFGGVKAVNDLSLSLFPNRINAIIGPNGAGKTTLFNLITGFIKPDSGKIFFDDVELTHLPIHAISRMGIKRTLQIKSVFNSMTVYENLWITLSAQQGNLNPFKPIARYPDIQKRVEEVIEQLDLGRFQNTPAGALSYGDVALLEIGMAIITKPKMILFDEPVCGMSPAGTEKVVSKITSLAAQTHIVIIEHDMDVVFKMADEIAVLAFGSKLASGTPQEIGSNQQVKEVYFGTDEVDA
jgi:branched-chain amino acid transport system ATP-binding protein